MLYSCVDVALTGCKPEGRDAADIYRQEVEHVDVSHVSIPLGSDVKVSDDDFKLLCLLGGIKRPRGAVVRSVRGRQGKWAGN